MNLYRLALKNIFPFPGWLMAQVGGGLALLPAYRISHQEPATAKRE